MQTEELGHALNIVIVCHLFNRLLISISDRVLLLQWTGPDYPI